MDHHRKLSSEKSFFKLYSGDFNLENLIVSTQKVLNDSFYICNLSDIIRKYQDWRKCLPRVKPFYAVKCNDDINVLKTLASLGCSFDCASLWEIEKILALKVDPQRIIFANTTKIPSHIEFAKDKCNGEIRFMTFDNEDEIYKIFKVYPDANLVLRIRHSSDKAKYKLGKKFGAVPGDETIKLLNLAKSLNLNVIGISFHIGSSCEDYKVYCEAIEISRSLFEIAAGIGYKFSILDIGGGFPGDNWSRITEFSGMINDALNEHFPEEKFPYLEILSEPGRYFVESAFTLVAQIHSRKISKGARSNDDDSPAAISDVMYYLNEGVYSNFLFIPLGPEYVTPQVLASKRSAVKFNTTIWGPTCDSTDKICENIPLELLEIGDVLYFENMGAYTIPLSTRFNGFQITKIAYFIRDDECNKLKQCGLFEQEFTADIE